MRPKQVKLRRGERIVWQGTPEPHYVFAAFAIRFVVGWSVIFACIASVIYISLWMLIPAVPLFFAAGLWADDARVTREKDITTWYAVTNRRAIVSQEKPRQDVRSFMPNNIGQVEFRNSRFGVTDVLFNHAFRGVSFGPDGHTKCVSTGFLRTRDRDGARDALEAISNMDPRDRLPSDKVEIINITPAIPR